MTYFNDMLVILDGHRNRGVTAPNDDKVCLGEIPRFFRRDDRGSNSALLAIAAFLVATPLQRVDAQVATNSDQEMGNEALREITVTATRTSQSLDKVPVSNTALTSEAIESQGIRDMDDVTRLAPGESFDHGLGSTTSISIRGIASNSGAATSGVYINDTPVQSRDIGEAGTNSNAYPTIFDPERVEVLRGSQGALFGAGSQGGTTRFIPPQPDLTRNTAFVRSDAISQWMRCSTQQSRRQQPDVQADGHRLKNKRPKK